MNTKTTHLLLSAGILLGAVSAHGAAVSFNFEDPKGVNNVAFNLDAPLEAISGTSNGISGTVSFDPQNIGSTAGTIVVDATTIKVPNNTMLEHLHSAGWLDTATHGTITFEATKLKDLKTDGARTTATAIGTFTLKGVTKDLSVPVTLTYLPGKLADRTNGQMQGDLLVIRSSFSINRSEFGIKPGQNTDKVAEQIEITLAIAGYAAKG
ncbi:MAG: YceI family protein [Puniceicoccaceae bacterium]